MTDALQIVPAYPGAGGSSVQVDGSILTPSGARDVIGTLVAFGAGRDGSLPPIPVALGSGITWGFKSGTAPQTAAIRMQRQFVDAIVNAVAASSDKALSMTIGGEPYGGRGLSASNTPLDITFERLVLLPPTSGDYVHDTLNIADRRFWWNRTTVTRSYNIVRSATDQFVYGGTSIAHGGKGLAVATRYFTEWSVNSINGQKTPWTAIAIVHDILTNILNITNSDIIYGAEVLGSANLPGAQILSGGFGASVGQQGAWAGVSPGNISIGSGGTPDSAYIPQNVQILGESADVVLGRYLRMAGADLYIGADGKIYVYSTVTVPAVSVQQTLSTTLGGYLVGGALNVVNLAAIRPVSVKVEFEREYEMIFAYEENGQDTTSKVAKTQADAEKQINNRIIYVENVTRTLVNDQVPKFPRGSYVPIQAALASFGTQFGSGTVTLDTMREYYGQSGVAAVALALGLGANTNAYVDPLAVSTWQQIRNDYRTLFRIPAVVMERLKEIKPLLAGVLFPETGTRAPAEVYGQITWIADVNVRIATFTGNGLLLNSAATNPQTPIPADATGFDQDTGVIQVTYRDHLAHPGFLRDVIPGTVKGDLAPLMTTDGWAIGAVAVGDGVMPAFIGEYGLTDTFTMRAVASVVVQPVQGNPPTVLGFSSTASDTGIGAAPGAGPPMTLPVSRIDTARYSLPATGDTAPYRNPAAPVFDSSVIVGTLQRVATEEAKRVYYTFQDALEGSATYAWGTPTVSLRPFGHMRDVRMTVGTDGKLNVSVSAPQWKTPTELYNLLPHEVLKFTEKQIASTQIGVRGGV